MKKTAQSNPPRGSLTLTMREGEEVCITTESGETVTFYIAKLSAQRVSVNIRAPREYPIDRVPAE